MYEIFVWIGVGLLLLNLVWCLFKNYAAGLDVETEDPVKLLLRSGVPERFLRQLEGEEQA